LPDQRRVDPPCERHEAHAFSETDTEPLLSIEPRDEVEAEARQPQTLQPLAAACGTVMTLGSRRVNRSRSRILRAWADSRAAGH
jgi:hypothetical protein